MTCDDAPFSRGQVVVCDLAHMTVRQGDRLRIISCERGDCGSGWLVSATSQTRGQMPKNPSVAISDTDSTWFRPIK